MSFAAIPNLCNEVYVDGIIEYVYEDAIPDGAVRVRGKHWFLRQDNTTIKESFTGSIRGALALPETVRVTDIGFWSIEGVAGERIDCRIGDHIRARLSLRTSNNQLFYVVSGVEGAVLKEDNGEWKSAHLTDECDGAGNPYPNYGRVGDYPPLKIGWNMLGGEILSRSRDIFTACDMWTAATGISITAFPYDPQYPGGFHYHVSFADLGENILGRTEVTPRPGAGACYNLWMSSTASFSVPGQQARSNEYDFVSVIAHEIGHAIGMCHFGLGVMHPSFSLGEVHTGINVEEQARVKSLYGL